MFYWLWSSYTTHALKLTAVTRVVWTVNIPELFSFVFPRQARCVSLSVMDCLTRRPWLHKTQTYRTYSSTHRLFALQDGLSESLGNVVIRRQSCVPQWRTIWLASRVDARFSVRLLVVESPILRRFVPSCNLSTTLFFATFRHSASSPVCSIVSETSAQIFFTVWLYQLRPLCRPAREIPYPQFAPGADK